MPEKEEKIRNAKSDKELLKKTNNNIGIGEITMKSVVANAISNGITTENVAEADKAEQTQKLKKEIEKEWD